MVPLFFALKAEGSFNVSLCVTAQHRELLDQVLKPFGIEPDFDLNIMQAGQTLTDINARVLYGMAPIIEGFSPDMLLVHGDTTTTFAASLAAFYQRVKIGHVEAGLRSFDKYRPYPEEINRKLTTALADFHFAPTEVSRRNLLNENVPDKKIFVTGNTAIDFLRYTVDKNRRFSLEMLNELDFSKRLILLTAHRRENWGRPLEQICRAVLRVVNENPDTLLVCPVHPGEAVREAVSKHLHNHSRIVLTEPLDVFDMHNLMSRALLLLTDSGGLQEEAPSFDLPVIVLREVTERPEGKDAGTLVLAGVEEESIYANTINLMTNKEIYDTMAQTHNPFGDGKASERILEVIKTYATGQVS